MAKQWDPLDLPKQPGLYINFKEAAIAQVSGGQRGIVAMPLFKYGSAVAGKFFTVTSEAEAVEFFGSANVEPIRLALLGGAKEVLAYTVPTIVEGGETAAHVELRQEFEARLFNVFVYPSEVSTAEQDATLLWTQTNRKEGKHFFAVFGGTAAEDLDPAAGNTRTAQLADDYSINVINGVVVGEDEYSSSEYAPYIAGLVAGTALNQSTTFSVLPVDDVTKRLRNSEIKTALEAGSLVLVHDGEKVKVEQGLTASKKKIRTIAARQAVATDIDRTARDSYIGKLNNNEDGQVALIAAVKAYLETLEQNGVLTDIVVGIDPDQQSVGDQVYLVISYRELDSMERIFININV
jgi:Phage tail sheath protein subtilisin-like domain/Phage tail sheath C-terminal domain